MVVSRNWHNLREFLRKTYNKEVNEWFRDVQDDIPDNSTSRNNAKRACLILPKESQNMALLKTLNFRYNVQRTHLRPFIYGTPIGSFDKVRRHRPQVVLEFREDELDVEAGFSPLYGRISFRLMDEDSETLTIAKLTTIANRVKVQFGGRTEYIWKKGKDLASYVDKNNGYQLQLLVRSKADAKELVEKVLAYNNDTPNFKYLSYKEADAPTDAYPIAPGSFISKLDRDELARVFVFCKYLHELFCKISINVTSEQLEVKQSMDEVKEKMSAGLGMCELILNAQSEISLDK